MSDAQKIKVREVLKSRSFTDSEKFIVLWQMGMLGDFRQSLIEAICQADDANLAELAKGFPNEVAAHHAWKYGVLPYRLRNAGLEI